MPFFNKTRTSASDTRRAITTCIVAQAVGVPLTQVMVNGGVLALFLLALGASKFAVGAAFAVNFVGQVARVFAAPHIDVAFRKRIVISWLALSTLIFGGFFLSLHVLDAWGSEVAVWFVVVSFLIQRVALNIAGHAWMSMLTVIIPRPLRGRFFGRMRATFQLVSLGLLALIGWYLGADPEPRTFMPVFAVLFVMSGLRPVLMLTLPNPPPDRPGPRNSLLKNMITPLRDRGWREFLAFWAILAFTANMARPFAVPFLKQNLAFPSSVAVYASATLILGMILGLTPWGRLADRLGNKVVFLANILILSAAFNVLALTPGYARARWVSMFTGVLAFTMIGVAIGGLGIGHTVRQMHAAPAESRSSYMALFFTTNGLAAGTATLLAGALLDLFPRAVTVLGVTLSPIRLFFVASSLAVAATAVLLWRLDAVAEKPIQVAVADLLALLPRPLTYPLRAVDLHPHDRQQDPGKCEEDADR